jgi:hypothetical protein
MDIKLNHYYLIRDLKNMIVVAQCTHKEKGVYFEYFTFHVMYDSTYDLLGNVKYRWVISDAMLEDYRIKEVSKEYKLLLL